MPTFRDFLHSTMEFCSPHYKDHHDFLLQLSKSSLQPTETCKHPRVLKEICVDCGKRMDDDYGVAFNYITKGLKFSNDEICRLKRRNTENLFNKKKLQLVLDLDHTLLHAVKLEKLSKNQRDALQDISSNNNLIQLENGHLVKLRPYVHNFLQEASNIFEMYIFTKGCRDYAQQIAKLLDSEGKYFNSRVICRKDLKRGMLRKTLNLVLGQEHGIIILDDTESVWNKHKKNLIVVEKYYYFNEKKYMNTKISYSENKIDESESNGVLINLLKSLRTVHGLFFGNPECRDVRILLGKIRREILKGCTLFFSSDVEDLSMIWGRANKLGAECKIMLDSSVTHVVSSSGGNNCCRWAEEKKKFLVHPRWVNAAYYYWCRQPEEDYYALTRDTRELLMTIFNLCNILVYQ